MRASFPHRLLPYLLVAPQLAISLVFFYWTAAQGLRQSALREDPFGLRTQFVGLANLARVLGDPAYLNALKVTMVSRSGRPCCRWRSRCCSPPGRRRSCGARVSTERC